MSVRLIVGTQVINFPTSGTDPNWAPAVVEFAQAVTDQLASISSRFDISPRVQVLTSNANTNIDINNVIFPSGSVRSFEFTYAIYRTASGPIFSISEEGTVFGVFDTLSATWTLQHDFEGSSWDGSTHGTVRQVPSGLPYHTFSMSGDQLVMSSVALPGAYDNVNSKISYAAKTILVSDI